MPVEKKEALGDEKTPFRVSTVYYHHARILCSTFSTYISDNNNNTQQIRFVSVTSSFFGQKICFTSGHRKHTQED
jgi:hypothetical protein